MNFQKLLACLLVASLVLSVLGRISIAKKPPKPPDPPSPPVEYDEIGLPSPDATRITEAWDVNDAGTVVGRVRSFDPWGRALVWYGPDYIDYVDLNDRFVLPDGITLTEAGCINNDGWIAGSVDDNQTEHWGDGIFACNLNAYEIAFLPSSLFPNPVRNARATGIGMGSSPDSPGMVVGTFGDLITGTTRLFLWNPMDPIDEFDDILMIVDLDPEDPPGHCGIDPQGETVVGKLLGNIRAPIFRFDVATLEPGVNQIVPEILADDSHQFYGNITINGSGTVAGSIQHKGKNCPARLDLSMDWELLTSNRKQYGASTDINSLGDICGGEFAGGQGFVFFNSSDSDIRGFWELDDLGARTVWLREPSGISNAGDIVGTRSEIDQPGEAFILMVQPAQ